jgi:hypothetical protein
MDVSQQSLGDLKKHYSGEIRALVRRQAEHEEQAAECKRKIKLLEAKLRHVEALLGGAPASRPAAVAGGKKKGKRRRQSPVRDATLAALRARPGERLTTRQLVTAIRKDRSRRVSRQAVNVNLGLLEREGLVLKEPAPAGSGARFVYSVVPRA